jgi:hypothetical protein
MMGTGPFDLQPYAIATSTIAIFIAKRSESDRNENLDSLIGLGVQVQDMFGRLVDRGTGTFGIEHFPGSTADVPKALPVPSPHLQIYPSPANDRCTVRMHASTERHATIEIIDLSGAVVRSLSAQVVRGLNEITLDLRELSAGNYIARIDHQTQAFTIVR